MAQGVPGTSFSFLLRVAVAVAQIQCAVPAIVPTEMEASCSALREHGVDMMSALSPNLCAPLQARSLLAYRVEKSVFTGLNSSMHVKPGTGSELVLTERKVDGKNAPLNSSGFQAVVEAKSYEDMQEFILRLINAMHLTVVDMSALNTVVPSDVREWNYHTFDNLTAELENGTMSHGNQSKAWLAKDKFVRRAHIVKVPKEKDPTLLAVSLSSKRGHAPGGRHPKGNKKPHDSAVKDSPSTSPFQGKKKTLRGHWAEADFSKEKSIDGGPTHSLPSKKVKGENKVSKSSDLHRSEADILKGKSTLDTAAKFLLSKKVKNKNKNSKSSHRHRGKAESRKESSAVNVVAHALAGKKAKGKNDMSKSALASSQHHQAKAESRKERSAVDVASRALSNKKAKGKNEMSKSSLTSSQHHQATAESRKERSAVDLAARAMSSKKAKGKNEMSKNSLASSQHHRAKAESRKESSAVDLAARSLSSKKAKGKNEMSKNSLAKSQQHRANSESRKDSSAANIASRILSSKKVKGKIEKLKSSLAKSKHHRAKAETREESSAVDVATGALSSKKAKGENKMSNSSLAKSESRKESSAADVAAGALSSKKAEDKNETSKNSLRHKAEAKSHKKRAITDTAAHSLSDKNTTGKSNILRSLPKRYQAGGEMSKKSKQEVELMILGVIKSMNLKVVDQAALHGFVGYYSESLQNQSSKTLRAELRLGLKPQNNSKAWLVKDSSPSPQEIAKAVNRLNEKLWVENKSVTPEEISKAAEHLNQLWFSNEDETNWEIAEALHGLDEKEKKKIMKKKRAKGANQTQQQHQ